MFYILSVGNMDMTCNLFASENKALLEEMKVKIDEAIKTANMLLHEDFELEEMEHLKKTCNFLEERDFWTLASCDWCKINKIKLI